MACLGSQVFPRVQVTSADNASGNVVHGYLAAAKTMGKGAALAAIDDDEMRAKCDAIDLESIPAGADSELTVAWDPDTDTGRILGSNLGRDYTAAMPGEFVGTADLVGRVADAVEGGDFKTGLQVKKARDSWQARALSLFSARAIGAESARFTMLYLGHDGRWYPDKAEFDAMDLSTFADELRALKQRIGAVRAAFAATGALPALHVGPHCRYCPSVPFCPAQGALAKAMVSDLSVIDQGIAALTDDEAGRAWEMLRMAEKLVERIKEGLQERARVQPIPLPDGKVLQEVPWSSTKIDGKVALRVLKEEGGDDLVFAAASVSKASIDRALAAAGKGAKEAKLVLGEIERAGGIRMMRSTQVRAVAAKK